MEVTDSDREEIDLLVRGLARAEWMQPKAASGAGQEAADAELRPGSRWTNVRIMMPAAPSARPANRFGAAAAALLSRLPALPNPARMFTTPGSAMLVRMWVGLGAVYSASLTFWPYPKTYFWGLGFYLISLALMLVTGVWGARLSWEARLGAAHTVALGTVLWAVGVAATQTLPLI